MSNNNFQETGIIEYNSYTELTDKQRNVAANIEKSINGLSYKEAEQLLFAVLSKIKEFSLVSLLNL